MSNRSIVGIFVLNNGFVLQPLTKEKARLPTEKGWERSYDSRIDDLLITVSLNQ